jgi:hypothetical protein|tara:strand:- start:2890 stop:3117 length:228 start_codon:yes stop_codon:yes gene_type:complete
MLLEQGKNKMTNQEKNQTLQTLNEITLLLDEAISKYENELPQEARIKYSNTYSSIGKAEESLNNLPYELFYKEVK